MEQLIPWINRTFEEAGITLQQDGADTHTANVVQDWCKNNMPGFLGKDLWPPSSPDLNTINLLFRVFWKSIHVHPLTKV